MVIAGEGYRVKEVRDMSFKLQEEGMANLRGNRKLTKAKIGDAFSSLKPTDDQNKVMAGVLYALKQVQTVCFNEDTKTIWTVPEDLTAWSANLKTLWVSGCEKALVGDIHMGRWLAEREGDGWTIQWPVAEGTFEEIKARAAERGVAPRVGLGAGKPKKEDWARTLGRAEAIAHLG